MIPKVAALLCVLLALSSQVYCKNKDKEQRPVQESYTPLYTGTILAYFSENIPPGQLLVEPYIYQTTSGGSYNGDGSFLKKKRINQTSLQLLLETGITSFLDFTLLVTGSQNQTGNHHTTVYKDTQAFFGLQFLEDKKGTALPDLRLVIGESFPTGQYQKLNPETATIGSGGVGSYQTIFVLVAGKIFYTFPRHPFKINLNLESVVSTKTNVSGFNLYGGAYDTKGTVDPGTGYTVNLAFEFSLTRKWVIGSDIHYVRQNKIPFKGNPGTLPSGAAADAGLPSSNQLSLAPTLEYSYNENFGLLGGAWFTVTGSNTPQFFSGVFSAYYAF